MRKWPASSTTPAAPASAAAAPLPPSPVPSETVTLACSLISAASLLHGHPRPTRHGPTGSKVSGRLASILRRHDRFRRMRFVRNSRCHAWVPHGRYPCPVLRGSMKSSSCHRVRSCPEPLGGAVQDLLYIGLVIVVFAALWLLIKGVERFER